MHERFDNISRWTSLAAFLLILLLCAGADGLMDKLGPELFLVVGGMVLVAAWALVEGGQHEKETA